MVAHLFKRFYVVTKFILPTMHGLKLSPINCDRECRYLENLDDNINKEIKTHIKDSVTYCIKVRPYMVFTKCRLMCETKRFAIH